MIKKFNELLNEESDPVYKFDKPKTGQFGTKRTSITKSDLKGVFGELYTKAAVAKTIGISASLLKKIMKDFNIKDVYK